MDTTSLRIKPKSRLSDDVAWRIEFAVKGGQFKPGEKLPSERLLSRELGVSRPILRQALQNLENRGLVNIQHGRGTFVASLANQFVAPIEWLRENDDKVIAFYEARMAIEPACAALAARRATPSQINELRDNTEESRGVAAAGDILSFVSLDIEFHSIIARLSGNPHLYHALDQIINPETDARQVIHRLPGHLPIAQARHERVFAAIAAKNEEAARGAMYAAFSGLMSELEEISH
jgi:GntR family transcriptional repressor for pyruvate dehydrogenase complex